MNKNFLLKIIMFTPSLFIAIILVIIISNLSFFYQYKIELNNIFIAIFILFIFILFFISFYISKIIENFFKEYELQLLSNQKIKFESSLSELKNILNGLPLMIIYKDIQDNIISINTKAVKSLGIISDKITNVESKYIFPTQYKKYYEDDLEVIKSKKIKFNILEYYETKNGVIVLETSRIPLFNMKGEVENIIVLSIDITEENKLRIENEKQKKLMYHQGKMAAIGEMIGNIVNQWSKPLSIILTTSSGVKLQQEIKCLTNDQLSSAMDLISSSVNELSQITDDFKSFFDFNKSKVGSFDILHAFDQTLNLVIPQFSSENIEIVRQIENKKIISMENELIQVLINILNNSRDALVKNQLEKRFIFINSYSSNNILFIEIKDNAKGINENILEKIFDSYFTTKKDSQGSGIGLYMSMQIVTKLLNGIFKVKNETFIYNNITYKGAKFTIELKL